MVRKISKNKFNNFLAIYSLVFFFLASCVVAKEIGRILILRFDQQKEKINIYKIGENYYLDEDKVEPLDISAEEIKISWKAEFKYPWQGEEFFSRTLLEENLNWTWKKSKDTLIGKTEIETCPVGLEYFLEEGKLKARIYFTNKTNYPVEDLTYRFVVKYPPDFYLNENNFALVKGEESLKIESDFNALRGSLTKLFDGINYSAAEFSIYVGTVEPGEYSQAIINLFTQ